MDATGLRPVSLPPSLAADRLHNDSASDDRPDEAIARGDVRDHRNGQVTAEEHWPEAVDVHARGNGRQSNCGQVTAEEHGQVRGTRAAAQCDAPTTTHPSPLTPPRKRRGPAKMTPVRQDEVIHYVRAGLSVRQAAAFVGCHHTTIVKAAQRDPDFAWKLEKAETMADAMPLVRVIRASRQSWQAAAWLVKNHQPCAALRRARAAERDAEAAESLVRLDRLIRQQAPDVEVKALIRGDRVSVELRTRG